VQQFARISLNRGRVSVGGTELLHRDAAVTTPQGRGREIHTNKTATAMEPEELGEHSYWSLSIQEGDCEREREGERERERDYGS
jgi:hypothetical protein